MAYLGNDLTVAYPTYKSIDDISGSFNGSTTSFALLVNGAAPVPLPLSSNQCLISVGGVVQRPDDSGAEGFRLSGGNIVFSSAPSTGEDFFGVILAGADYVNAGANFPDGTLGAPSITFDQDNDTGFYRSGSGFVSFASNGVAAGTFSSGGFQAVAGSAGSPSITTIGDTNTGIFFPTADTIAFSKGGVESVRIDSTGKVGLGTSTVGYPLTIQNTSRPQVHISYNGNGGLFFRDATDTARINWQVSTSEYNAGAFQITPSTTAGGTTFTTPAITVDSSSRVGIGTTSPQGLLHLGGGNPVISVDKFSSGFDNFIYYNNTTSANELFVGRDSSSVIIRTGGAERARIDSSGRLLVGTSTSPSAGQGQYSRIVVQGYIGADTDAGYLALARGEGAANIASGEDLGVISFNDNVGNTFAYILATADANAGSGDYPGRIVFATTADGASSPTERLKINRNGTLFSVPTYNNTAAISANVFVDSDGSIGRSTSSSKYKTSVETIEDQYSDALLNCRPVWYRSTCKTDNPNYGWWGFIAEEVAEIDPRLVHWKTTEPVVQENGSIENVPCNPEAEGVAYDRFVPHLLNLIKRQGEAIAELQAKVAALEGA